MINAPDTPLGWAMVVLQLLTVVQLLRLELKLNAKIAKQAVEIAVIKTQLRNS